MRALEKNLLVVSTVESRRRDPSPETVMDNKAASMIYMNGNHNGGEDNEANNENGTNDEDKEGEDTAQEVIRENWVFG